MELHSMRQCCALIPWILLLSLAAGGQTSSSSSAHGHKRTPSAAKSEIDPGEVTNGVYRNKALGLACKIPDGWVQRTEEMNARESAQDAGPTRVGSDGSVLLAAFSRPPQARGSDINSSIVIAIEPLSSYPGLKQAAEYFGPLTEIAKSQGFTVDEEPYEFAVGSKQLARSDFHKDVGARVMRQSTLVLLARGYAVSMTFIGGTEDELEELVGGLSFAVSGKPGH
jgi:hypothetical protein